MSLSQNLETKDIRTKDGNIRFGHIHNDQGKSSIMLQGQGGLEYISLEQVGKREGWIWSRCRGRYQITCGDNIKKDDVAFYLNVSGADGFSKGNIEIVTKGTFKVQAENIQLIASGNNNSNGVISLQSNEKIELDSKQINVSAKEAMGLYASDLNTSASNIMKMTAGTYQKLSNASALVSPVLSMNIKALGSVLGSISKE
jgi:hypothetical protein